MVENADRIEQMLDYFTIKNEFLEPIGELATYFNDLDKLLTETILSFIAPLGIASLDYVRNARIVLNEINSFAVRQRMLQRIVDALPDGEERKEFLEVLDSLENANKSRNQILHANWSSYFPKQQILTAETKREPIDYSATDIKFHAKIIRYALLRLSWALLQRGRVLRGEPPSSLDRPFQPPQR